MLYLAARYPDDFEAALIANTNVGGRQLSPRAVLGAITGRSGAGRWGDPRTLDPGPCSRAELHEEIESFITRFGEATVVPKKP